MSYAKQIDEIQKWIEKNSGKYHEVKKGFEDINRMRAMITEQIPALLAPLLEYDPKEHGSDVAVVACTEVRVRAMSLLENIYFKETYEEKKEQLDQFLSYDQSDENSKEEPLGPGESEPDNG